jgi:hypothetical protein
VDVTQGSTGWTAKILKGAGLMIIACVAAVATSWLVIIAFVVFGFIYAVIINDPTAGEVVQIFIFCFIVWPAAIAGGAISILAAGILFNRSFRKRPLLFSILSGVVGGILPYLVFLLSGVITFPG